MSQIMVIVISLNLMPQRWCWSHSNHKKTFWPWSWRLILFWALMISSSCCCCCLCWILNNLKASSSALLGLFCDNNGADNPSLPNCSPPEPRMEFNCGESWTDTGNTAWAWGNRLDLELDRRELLFLISSRSISACMDTINVSGSSFKNWEMANCWISRRLLMNWLNA